VAAAKLPAGGEGARAGTRATFVAVTTSAEVAPDASFVTGGGVAVTKETRGTVTAVVMVVAVEAEEMIWVYEIMVAGHEILTVGCGGGRVDVMTVPDRVMVA
jgi:hypothetical protein